MASRPLHIIFRADASIEIGSGHVMRCLSLANALVERGARCTFLSRALRGNLIDHINAAGHAVQNLTAPVGETLQRTIDGDYASWLGVSVAQDACDCKAIIDRLDPDLVVVDHYALDKGWEIAACGIVPVLVIDDLANREHHCDILLDQNLGRKAGDYDDLVPDHALLLIGPENALLRPEFASARAGSLARRSQGRGLRSLLVAMGGGDRDNATGAILDVLAGLPICRELKISVVLGPAAPWLGKVREQAAAMPCLVDVLVNVQNMATLLSDADLAIGAAGGSAWERCCLGVPTLVLTLGDNQKPGAQALSRIGAIELLGDIRDTDWRLRLAEGIRRNTDPKSLGRMAAAAAAVTAGIGADRLTTLILSTTLVARRTTMDDAYKIWEWRNAGQATLYYKSQNAPHFDEHLVWLRNALNSHNRILMMVERDGDAIGHVRFDLDPLDATKAVVSISVSPKIRGQKLSGPIMRTAFRHAHTFGIDRVFAAVHHENTASMRLFASLGFSRISCEGDFDYLALDLPFRIVRDVSKEVTP